MIGRSDRAFLRELADDETVSESSRRAAARMLAVLPALDEMGAELRRIQRRRRADGARVAGLCFAALLSLVVGCVLFVHLGLLWLLVGLGGMALIGREVVTVVEEQADQDQREWDAFLQKRVERVVLPEASGVVDGIGDGVSASGETVDE